MLIYHKLINNNNNKARRLYTLSTYFVHDVISESRSSEWFVMAMGEVDGSTYACFCYEHFSYVFSFRPCRLSEVVQEGICPNEITLNTTFSNTTLRVCMGKECTFVCVHSHSTPAHSNTEIRYVSTLGDVTASSIFDTKDFEWLSSGLIAVPFSSLMCVVNDPGAVESMTRQMMVTLKGESSKNEIIEQVIKLRLGDEFTVTHKPVVERKGRSLVPTANPDMICVYSTKLIISSAVVPKQAPREPRWEL